MEQLIGGRYEVIEALGRGGMAVVHRARDLRLLREVAVKVLSKATNEQSIFYFHREARAIASLSHGNIVQIYDYSGPEETPAYIVMQLIGGANVEKALMRLHPLPEEVLLAVGKQVAAALGHAHAKGVIHRDLKPANVMVEFGGRVLLTDFGLAKSYLDESLLGKTAVGQKTQLFGTPDFMAPEQLRHQAPGPHTDMFSLGVMMHFMSARRVPFYHADVVSAMRRIVNIDYDSLTQERSDVSKQWVALLESCFSGDAQQRPTAEAFAGRCHELLARRTADEPEVVLRKFLERFGGPEEPKTLDETHPPRGNKPPPRDPALPTTDPMGGTAKEAARARPTTPDRPLAETDKGPPPAAIRRSASNSAAARAAREREEVLNARTFTDPGAAFDELMLATQLETNQPPRARGHGAWPVWPMVLVTLVTFVAVLGLAWFVDQRGAGPITGTVRLEVRPEGEIFVNGKRVGRAPPMRELNLTPGQHVIVATHADNRKEWIIDLDAGESVILNFDLR